MKSGFVAILGEPNVGKSTLLNAILNEKVSIVSPKPQTTRNKILGIYNDDDGQIVFIDTPGIHKSKNKLDEYMSKAISSAKSDTALQFYRVFFFDNMNKALYYFWNPTTFTRVI